MNTDRPALLAHSRLVIGIPSVRRRKDYLVGTIASLVDGIPPEAMERVEIVVLNAEVDPADNAPARGLPARFPELFESGRLRVIENPGGPAKLRDFNPGASLPGRSPDGRWEAKLVLDALSLFTFCAGRGEYYLHVEDDMLASRDWYSKMLAWIDGHYASRRDWSILCFFTQRDRVDERLADPRELGTAAALLFRSSDLPRLVKHVGEQFDRLPFDWLLGNYVAESQGAIYVCVPTLFQHVGVFSSCPGVLQPSYSRTFREPMTTTYSRNAVEILEVLRYQPRSIVKILVQRVYKPRWWRRVGTPLVDSTASVRAAFRRHP